MLEPAALGKAVVFGPYTSNFRNEPRREGGVLGTYRSSKFRGDSVSLYFSKVLVITWQQFSCVRSASRNGNTTAAMEIQ